MLHNHLEFGTDFTTTNLGVKDASAAAKVPEGDGYAAAVVNFRFIANTVWTTKEAVHEMKTVELAAAQ